MRELLALLAGLSSPAQNKLPDQAFYVDLGFSDAKELHRLVEQGHDVAGIDWDNKNITLVVRGSGLDSTHSFAVDNIRQVDAPDQEYKDPADIAVILKEIETEYPHLATVESIGKSLEGRDILAIRLTARFVSNGQEKPSILFDSMHHAREVMTPEVAIDIAEFLTENYAKDAKVQQWMNDYEIWVVPMVNPDGNAKMWESDNMWRKNTRDGHGVDINRNYPHEWNSCNGSSGSKFSQTYRGESPSSEPETQAITDLAKRIKPVFNISYHSFSEIVIFPFGCNPKRIPEKHRATYEGIADKLAKKLVRDSGSGTYKAGTSYQLLYNVDGGSVDWMYSDELIMSYVVEVNSTAQGFQPSYAQWRDKTVKGQRPGWQFLLDRMSDTSIR